MGVRSSSPERSYLAQVDPMAHPTPFSLAAADYPNHLAAPQPKRLRLPPARLLLVGLVLLCLVPRAMMALRIPGVCPDGVLYIHLAQSIEAGDLRTGFQEMAVNLYPMVLALLHRVGLPWELAAALWGIVISSLVVLPLWGWVRRQFDDRVALVACLLYVVHAKMIEWSPEVMRDPTFWFLFMLAIYWLWRAVTEVRLGYFIAAGAGIILASLTRIEGVFLLIPLVLWTFWRYRALQTDRKKLLWGAALCMFIFPLLVALVNMAWLLGHADYTAAIRLSPLARVQPWLASVLDSAPAESGIDGAMNVRRMLWIFFPTMTRGLSPVFALLMFGGIWKWRRVWSRRDHQPLFYTAVAIMCGIWIQLWYDKNICPRYALPIVLMASPLAALGLLGLMSWLTRIAQRLQWGTRAQVAVMTIAAATVAAIDLAGAMTCNQSYFETRRMSADLGRRLGRELSAPPRLVGPVGITPIVGYYARANSYEMFRCEAEDASILGLVEHSDADAVVLRPWKQLTAQRCASLVEQMKRLGLEPLSSTPNANDDFYVVVRAPRLETSQKSTQRR